MRRLSTYSTISSSHQPRPLQPTRKPAGKPSCSIHRFSDGQLVTMPRSCSSRNLTTRLPGLTATDSVGPLALGIANHSSRASAHHCAHGAWLLRKTLLRLKELG